MKKLLSLCAIASLAFMIGCGNAGDKYISAYENIVVKYEKMANTGNLSAGDYADMVAEIANLKVPEGMDFGQYADVAALSGRAALIAGKITY